ncbi:MAG: PAC2 family protein [Chloroflexi bacterium]|nr:PAC2 family protein [Chloroflexota bacterium]
MKQQLKLWKKPIAEEIVMIAGWRQWADAGAISSGLPQYLIDQTGAELIGEIDPDGFYLFQIPGTHHLLRPTVRFEEGQRQFLEVRRNEFYYAGNAEKGVVIFLGDEPHLGVDRYAATFFEAVQQLSVQQIASLGGVYGPVPYDKDREIGCIYSLPEMQPLLQQYAVRFSDYEGGASIGSYLIGTAAQQQIPFLSFYGFVPNYDFSQLGAGGQEVRIENDYKAWYDLMRRLNRLFELNFNLRDLEQKSQRLITAVEEQLDKLAAKSPQIDMHEIMAQISQQFEERPFAPLDDVWEQGLADLFDDVDE